MSLTDTFSLAQDRLKLFDGSSWLNLTPVFYDSSTPLTACANRIGQLAADHVPRDVSVVHARSCGEKNAYARRRHFLGINHTLPRGRTDRTGRDVARRTVPYASRRAAAASIYIRPGDQSSDDLPACTDWIGRASLLSLSQLWSARRTAPRTTPHPCCRCSDALGVVQRCMMDEKFSRRRFRVKIIAQFAITINSNVCPHFRVQNMLVRNPIDDVIGIFNCEARY